VIDIAASRGDKPLTNFATASDAASNAVVVTGVGGTITSLPTGNHLTHAGFEVNGLSEAQQITTNGTCGRVTSTVASGLGAYRYSPVNQNCGLGFTFAATPTIDAVARVNVHTLPGAEIPLVYGDSALFAGDGGYVFIDPSGFLHLRPGGGQ